MMVVFIYQRSIFLSRIFILVCILTRRELGFCVCMCVRTCERAAEKHDYILHSACSVLSTNMNASVNEHRLTTCLCIASFLSLCFSFTQVWDRWHIAQHVWLLWRWLFLRDSQPADKIRRGLGTRARRRPLWRLLPLDSVLSVRSFRYTLLPHYASYPRDPDQKPSIQNISLQSCLLLFLSWCRHFCPTTDSMFQLWF